MGTTYTNRFAYATEICNYFSDCLQTIDTKENLTDDFLVEMAMYKVKEK